MWRNWLLDFTLSNTTWSPIWTWIIDEWHNRLWSAISPNVLQGPFEHSVCDVVVQSKMYMLQQRTLGYGCMADSYINIIYLQYHPLIWPCILAWFGTGRVCRCTDITPPASNYSRTSWSTTTLKWPRISVTHQKLGFVWYQLEPWLSTSVVFTQLALVTVLLYNHIPAFPFCRRAPFSRCWRGCTYCWTRDVAELFDRSRCDCPGVFLVLFCFLRFPLQHFSGNFPTMCCILVTQALILNLLTLDWLCGTILWVRYL